MGHRAYKMTVQDDETVIFKERSNAESARVAASPVDCMSPSILRQESAVVLSIASLYEFATPMATDDRAQARDFRVE